jgi:hypothetical protein
VPAQFRAAAAAPGTGDKRAVRGHPFFDHDGGLTGIVEHQARKYDGRPSKSDRPRAEMSHVGIERFGSGDAELREQAAAALPNY